MLKCPLTSEKSLSHAGNNIEIRHFEIWKLFSYISDLRVLGREASKCLFKPLTSAQELWRWEDSKLLISPAPFLLFPCASLFKGSDFFSLSTFKPLSFPNLSHFLPGNAGILSCILPCAPSPEGQGGQNNCFNPGQRHANQRLLEAKTSTCWFSFLLISSLLFFLIIHSHGSKILCQVLG